MFRIFRKQNNQPGELQDVQLRPVEHRPVSIRLKNALRTHAAPSANA